jgi:Zn finger protein HypA/HybF involved in hydrogenase expression
MKLNLDSTRITITCPLCSQEFDETLGRLKDDPTIDCPGCHKPIKIEAGGLRGGLSSVQEKLDDLGRALGKIGK